MTERDTPEVLHARAAAADRRRPDVDPDLERPGSLHHPHRPFRVPPLHLGLVFVGGTVGTLARWGTGRLLPADQPWPWAILVVNLVGSFVLGAVLDHLTALGPDAGRRRAARLLLGVGFCGAFTTYSSFATAAPLLQPRDASAALGWLAANLFGCLLTAWLGMGLGERTGRARATAGGPR